ncbi:MAG: hypothetical protein ABIO70_18115 [Pseudomonadota bacterium]
MRAARVTLAAALLAGSGCDGPPTPPAMPPPAGEVFDHSAIIAGVIARIDDDGDGRVSPTEHARWSGQLTPFAELDLDRSGYLEPAEVEEAIRFVTPSFHALPQSERRPPG